MSPFFSTHPPAPDIYTLSLHDALPISIRVERSALQIVPLRPQCWSVVARPRDSVDMPLSWGSPYVVCPGCSHRQYLSGQQTEMSCDKFGGTLAFDWDEHTGAIRRSHL